MTDEDELFVAILAFQNGLILESQFLSAFRAWRDDRTKNLTSVLLQQQAIAEPDLQALLWLAERLLLRFDNNAIRATAELRSVSSICDKLASLAIDDTSLWKTISNFSVADTRDFAQPENPVKSEKSQIKLGSNEADDRFRIIKKHAQGGLGIVFVAQDNHIRREVALKQIRSDLCDHREMQSRFTQEAQITGQLEHPGIVPIYTLGTDKAGRPFYAMRFIRGEDLHSRIASFHQALSAAEIRFNGPELRGLLRRFVDICNAVHYAHDRGILHRDLKPGNIMIGKYGETLVVDWGLAKAFHSNGGASESQPEENANFVSPSQEVCETRQGSFVGTAAFAPPEQLRGRLDELSPASDVFSLGAILFQLLTGQTPSTGSTSFKHLLEIYDSGNVKRPVQLNPLVPYRLDAICMKCLETAMANRYTSSELLAREIENWLDDEPVTAYRDSYFERFSRWGRRNPSLCAAMIVTLGLLVSNAFLYRFIQNFTR